MNKSMLGTSSPYRDTEEEEGRRKLQRNKKTITREIVLNRDSEADSCEESQSP